MLAFVIACQTSRPGLLSDPVDPETRESFKKFMFSDIPDYHVYIVGDNDCYDSACELFGKERIKGFRNVLNEEVTIRQYYVYSEWFSNENRKFFHIANINNCHLFYKLDVARKMIEESGIDYKCIVKLRTDCVFQDEYQSYIQRVISDDTVQFIGNNDWTLIGKPGIMKNYMNMYNLPALSNFDEDYLTFENTGILSRRKFIEWLKDPDIHKNAAELVISMNILQYLHKNNTDMSKSTFMANRKYKRSCTDDWHRPSEIDTLKV
jgi:hypothetical protein